MSGEVVVAAPLPTLREIDAELVRSLVAEDMARAEIVDLETDILELRDSRDAMLECRTRIAGLTAHA